MQARSEAHAEQPAPGPEQRTEDYLGGEHAYRLDTAAVVLRLSIIIVFTVAAFFLLAYLQRPYWPTLVLLLVFSLFLPIGFISVWLVRQERMRTAMLLYVISASILCALFALFMPPDIVIVGMIGYMVMVRVTVYMLDDRAALILTWVYSIIYAAIIIIRWRLDVPQVDMGPYGVYLLIAVPVMALILLALLDRTSTQYLRAALSHSEAARHELAASYTTLEQQKKTIEVSEKNLALLADQLQHSNDDLNRLNEELKSFAYIVSHDLRAPLINLKGFSAELRLSSKALEPLVEAGLPHLSPGQQQQVRFAMEEDIPEALGFIETSAHRMGRLINAVLQLSRLGRRELTMEPIEMNALVADTLKSLAHQIEEKGVKVEVAVLPDVVADHVSIEQVMGNLLINAIMYLVPERPGEVEVAGRREATETVFWVKDNGRGIDEDDYPKVFQLFRRAGKQETPGEGMGLPYVQTLVRRHGGRIWFESEAGVGSTFFFTIARTLP